MDPALDISKAAARKDAYARRKAAHAAGQGQAAELLGDVLVRFAGQSLAGYMPMKTEADPLAAMAAHQGPVCVPVVMGQGLALRFREWTPGCPLITGAFGALIPADGAWITPDVLIVPLLAFDARGYRLGYGGGFYDRTLAALRRAAQVTAVGFGFATQQVDAVPIDANDERLDLMVTETGVLHFG